jgi:glutamine amidotransferase
MGWNEVHFQPGHPVLEGIESGSHFYFVHSYYPQPGNGCATWGTTEYAGVSFASLIGQKNLLACQFHAEKSGQAGLRLLKNFSTWDGSAPC